MGAVLVLAAGQDADGPQRSVSHIEPAPATLSLHQIAAPPTAPLTSPLASLLGPREEAVKPAPVEMVEELPAWGPPAWFPDDLMALEGINAGAERTGPDLRLSSRAVFVYDVDSGEVLLSRAADDRRPVASLTKVVAGLTLVSELPDLESEICLDQSTRPSWPGAVTRFRTGTCMSGWDYLGAALVRSDNRAAYAFPVIAGVPHDDFVDRMNQVSGELGMDMSTFSDPSGVEDDNLSTARDLTRAILAASIHRTLAPVVSAPFWDVKERKRSVRRMFTTNRLHERSRTEVLAAKTGYTNTARYCFSTVMRLRNNRRVALTTLGARWSRQRWSDVRKVLSWIEKGGPDR